MKIVDLGTVTDNNCFFTVERLLEDALQDRAKGDLAGKKAILIVLDEEGGAYTPRWRMAGGMKMSEGIGLLVVLKSIFLQKMGFK